MNNLTNLVIQYKKLKNNHIFNLIYKELQSIIKQKAKFIYFGKWYPLNMYHPCKYCRKCNKLKNIPKSERNIICEECEKCTCIKGFFNLRKNNLCEYQDVENDLWTEVLRIIEDYDETKDFNTYLISSLWNFIPNFINKNFVTSILNKSLTQRNENGDDIQYDIPIEINNLTLTLDEIIKVASTKREKAVLNLYLKDSTMTLDKAGTSLGISHQAISLILTKLQKKLKIVLAKTKK
jgi:RNA polymerase sigma factor (sigma-70 family)